MEEDSFFISRPTTKIKARKRFDDISLLSPKQYLSGLRSTFFKSTSDQKVMNREGWVNSGLKNYICPESTNEEFCATFNKIDANNAGFIQWKDLQNYMIHETAPETKFTDSKVEMIRKLETPPEVRQNAHREPIKQVFVAKWLDRIITLSKDSLKFWKRNPFGYDLTIPATTNFKCFCVFEDSQILAVALVSRRIIFYHINELFVLPVEIGASPTPEIIKRMNADETRDFLKRTMRKTPIYSVPTTMVEAKLTERKTFQYKMLVGDKQGVISLISLDTPQRRNGTDYSVDLVTKKEVHTDSITQLLIIKDLNVYAASSLDCTVTFFSVVDNKINVERVFREENPITSFSYFEKTHSLAFCMKGVPPAVWTIQPPRRQLRITTQYSRVNISFAYEQNPGEKMFVTVSETGEIRFFNSSSFILLNEYGDPKLTDLVHSAAIDEERKSIILGSRYPIYWKSKQCHKNAKEVVTHKSRIVSIRYLEDFDRILSFDENGFYNICNYRTGKIERLKKTSSENIRCAEVDSGRRLFTSTPKGEIEVWNIFSSAQITTIPKFVNGTITCMKLFVLKSKNFIAYGTSMRQVVVFGESSPGQFEHVSTFNGNEKEISCVEFDPLTESVISGSVGGEIVMFPLDSNFAAKVIRFSNEAEIIEMKLVEQNLFILSADQNITVIVLPMLRIDSRAIGLCSDIPHLITAIDAGKELVVTGDSNGYIRIWEVIDGAFVSIIPISLVRCHEKEILSVMMIRDGTILVTSATDNLVRLWDISTMNIIGTVNPQSMWSLETPETWSKLTLPEHPKYAQLIKVNMDALRSTKSVASIAPLSTKRSSNALRKSANTMSRSLLAALKTVRESRMNISRIELEDAKPKKEEEKTFDWEKAYNMFTSYYSEDSHEVEVESLDPSKKGTSARKQFVDPMMSELITFDVLGHVKVLSEQAKGGEKKGRVSQALSMIVKPTPHQTFI